MQVMTLFIEKGQFSSRVTQFIGTRNDSILTPKQCHASVWRVSLQLMNGTIISGRGTISEPDRQEYIFSSSLTLEMRLAVGKLCAA